MTAEEEKLNRKVQSLRKSQRKQGNIQTKVPQKEIEKIVIKQLTSSRKLLRNEEYKFLN